MITRQTAINGIHAAKFSRSKVIGQFYNSLHGATKACFDEIIEWCKDELPKVPTSKQLTDISNAADHFFGLDEIGCAALLRHLECNMVHTLDALEPMNSTDFAKAVAAHKQWEASIV
ncbi:MAG: hypothetical protein GY811_06050 [Myxococcales bacterium]|nr:hypothetical protein [Myxococcales bacterium]